MDTVEGFASFWPSPNDRVRRWWCPRICSKKSTLSPDKTWLWIIHKRNNREIKANSEHIIVEKWSSLARITSSSSEEIREKETLVWGRWGDYGDDTWQQGPPEVVVSGYGFMFSNLQSLCTNLIDSIQCVEPGLTDLIISSSLFYLVDCLFLTTCNVHWCCWSFS